MTRKTWLAFTGKLLLSLVIFQSACIPSPNPEDSVMPVAHHVLRLPPGADLKASLRAFADEHHVTAGWIVTCVGSLTEIHLRYANQEEGTRLAGPVEIVSLTGTLAQSGLHVHMSISDPTGKTTGGHLLDGNLVYTTAELVLAVSSDLRFAREEDPTFGYKELVVYPVDQ